MKKTPKILLCIFSISCFMLSCSRNSTDSELVFGVVNVSPTNGERQVGLNDSILITFSQPPDVLSIDSNTILLNDSISGTVTIDNNTIIFSPTVPLDSNAVYYSKVSKTLSSVDGHSLSRDYSWSFSTVDGGAFNWNESADTAGFFMEEIIWSKNKFVMVGMNGISPFEGAIFVSSDGINWDEIKVDNIPRLYGIASYDNSFIAVGENGTMIKSLNGANWQKINTSFNTSLYDVTSSNNLVMALGIGRVYISSDAVSWEEIVVPFSGRLISSCWTGSQFVVTTTGDSMSYFLISPDGENWNKVSIDRGPGQRLEFYGVGASKELIIAVGPDQNLFTSQDGITWTEQDLGISNSEWVFLESVIWDGQRFVVVGGSHLAIGGFSAISEDGINWSHYKYVLDNDAGNGGLFNSIAWSGSKYVVASGQMSGRIFYSP